MNRAQAITKYVRISPRKARLAAGLIRGLPVEQAVMQLHYSNLKAGRLLKKTLESAVANAASLFDLRPEKMKVHEVRVDEGPTMKRAKPKNRGGRHPIMKRTSHFTVIVTEVEGV
jgi:large subunit ribosomal protein L22